MARPLFSLVCFCVLALSSFGQAFGRFGYEQGADVPGFKVDKDGFIATDPLADKIKFAKPSKLWKPVVTTQTEQTVVLSGGAGSPGKALFNLLGVGFSLYFAQGLDLRVGSLSAPYLSWEQGTVTENVAAPATGWLVVSFRDKQPPIVMGFPGGPASLVVTGKAGSWSIRSPGFKGWVRLALPQGLDAQLANTAGSLGRMAKEAAKNARLWTSMPPHLLKVSTAADLHSVTATWQFDRVSAIVPPVAMLANLGGYPLKVQSETNRVPGWTDSGPVDFLVGTALTIRFPVRRIPTGRCLAVGSQLTRPLGTASPLDIPSVAELALESLLAERDTQTLKVSSETSSEYINQAAFTLEPWTKQQLPFDRVGTGIDLAAAHAFLMQAITSTSRSTSEANSLLTSVSWRQDWLTWLPWAQDDVVAQRAGALAALAGALCPEPERRLTAAMFQAGISGRRGLNVWRRRKGFIDKEPKMIEPLYGVRKGLFGLQGPEADGEKFAASLMSPVRVFSDGPVLMSKVGTSYLLQTDTVEIKQYLLMLAAAYQVEVQKLRNVSSLNSSSALGFTEVHYVPEIAGPCLFRLKLPTYVAAPPNAVQAPSYSEPIR